jgi:hypothetical protein
MGKGASAGPTGLRRLDGEEVEDDRVVVSMRRGYDEGGVDVRAEGWREVEPVESSEGGTVVVGEGPGSRVAVAEGIKVGGEVGEEEGVGGAVVGGRGGGAGGKAVEGRVGCEVEVAQEKRRGLAKEGRGQVGGKEGRPSGLPGGWPVCVDDREGVAGPVHAEGL